MNVRVSMLRDIEKLKLKSKVLDNCCLIYSMWLGYKEEDIYKEFLSKMEELNIKVIDLHVSGHASYSAFKLLFDITKPDIVIPIHTEDKYKITEYTDKAVILNDMETLEINEKGDYKIIVNENIENDYIITYEEVIKRLQRKKLEDYSQTDLEERFIVYGTEQELEDPTIQHLLIKNNLYEELTDGIDIITDKQVILELLQSNPFQGEHISIIEGEILDIGKETLVTLKDNTNIYYSVVSIKDKATGGQYKLKAQVFLETKALNSYLKKIKPYYNNIVAIVSNTDDEKYIKCFMKSYEDIDYMKFYKSNS